VTEDEYYAWFARHGFKRTGESTMLTEEWSDEGGTFIMAPRPSELSPDDRAAAIERMAAYLGIDRPIGGGGVH
jgi:hypothetical protein